MPASRSARAMTFAPRSWPSRPGLAMTTRILRMRVSSFQFPASSWKLEAGDWKLYQRHLFVLAPHLPERVAHLADGRVRPGAVEQWVHRVGVASRRVPQRVEGPSHGVAIPRS